MYGYQDILTDNWSSSVYRLIGPRDGHLSAISQKGPLKCVALIHTKVTTDDTTTEHLITKHTINNAGPKSPPQTNQLT